MSRKQSKYLFNILTINLVDETCLACLAKEQKRFALKYPNLSVDKIIAIENANVQKREYEN